MRHLNVATCCLLLGLSIVYIEAHVGQMVCYYDSSSFIREGVDYMSVDDLDFGLRFCNYLVYGYAGIDLETYQPKPLDANLDINQDHYRTITALKRKHPQLRVLLSIGGDKDIELNAENSASDCDTDSEKNKYLLLLEDGNRRLVFVNSVANILKAYKFDGIDLAWQFPKNRPKIVAGAFKAAWNKVKSWFRNPKPIDEKSEEHKQQFVDLIRELKVVLNRDALMLTLTMLPNVNASLFIDFENVAQHIDFVNLAAFDFQTPTRNPKVADFPAPLYALHERNAENNIDYQVQLWLNNNVPAQKINVGIPAFGRGWIMSMKSGITGYPPVIKTHGAIATKKTIAVGLFSWPAICEMLQADLGIVHTAVGLRKVSDPLKRSGTYGYHAANIDKQTEEAIEGLWVGYEELDTAFEKAKYIKAKGLGGAALFDLSLDDFKGRCPGEKFTILRVIQFKLQEEI